MLIVEDEELQAFSTAKLLRKHGYETEIATTVSAALNLLDSSAPAAGFGHVLLDPRLPDADGEYVLSHTEGMAIRPNVIVVAVPQSLDRHRILALRRRCAFLPKPVNAETLLEMLAEPAHPGVDEYAREFALSPQERAVVHHAVAGLTDVQITEATNCSRSTVKCYWARIYLKLRVKGRAQVLAHFARWLMHRQARQSGIYRTARSLSREHRTAQDPGTT